MKNKKRRTSNPGAQSQPPFVLQLSLGRETQRPGGALRYCPPTLRLVSTGILFSCFAVGVAWGQTKSGNAAGAKFDNDVATGFSGYGVKETPPTKPPAAPTPAAQPAPPPVLPGPASTDTNAPAEFSPLMMPGLMLKPAPKNEISVSADYLLGQGEVTLPIGFSLVKSVPIPPGSGATFPLVSTADRDSDYYGATISYSFGQAWYMDVSYAQGESSGDVPINFGPGLVLPSQFTIEDTSYQAYVRYTFPRLQGKRLSAYVRAGITYVEAELTDRTIHPAFGVYTQQDDTEDILGNIGFGVSYALYVRGAMRLGVQAEGEGFYGIRSQDTLETVTGITPVPDSLDNNLYGGSGRLTLRFQYAFGKERLLKAFLDGGVQGKYTQIEYDGASNGSTFDELLWGPYVKVGIRYSF